MNRDEAINKFIKDIKHSHNLFQWVWAGWIPIALISWFVIGKILIFLGVTNLLDSLFIFLSWEMFAKTELYAFPFMGGVMYLYMRFLSSFEVGITKIICPYCSNFYFNEFPNFLRKTNCISCGERVNFYG